MFKLDIWIFFIGFVPLQDLCVSSEFSLLERLHFILLWNLSSAEIEVEVEV